MEKSLRKQLKEDMKDAKPIVGLVSIKNTLNNRVYIEGSVNAKALVNRIRFTLNSGQFKNKKLQQDWNEIGEKYFLFEIIKEIKYDPAVDLNYRKEVLKLEVIALNTLKLSGVDSYNEVAI
ncbi:hypothetical protein ACVW0P_003954 [Mucilaginibacter sp. UYNi724]